MVDRCVCMEVPFERLVLLSREEGLSLDGLRERTGCGGGCGLCLPYIRVALATGEGSVPLMRPERGGGAGGVGGG